MNTFFKIIFLIFICRGVMAQEEAGFIEGGAANQMLSDLAKRRADADREYDRALKLLDQGRLSEALIKFDALTKQGHAASKTILDTALKQRPDLAKVIGRGIPKADPLHTPLNTAPATPPRKESLKERRDLQKEAWRENKKKRKQQRIAFDYSFHFTAPRTDLGIGGKRTIAMLEENASRGNADALFNLGLFHQDGVYFKADAKTALMYFEEACNKGALNACVNAGHIHRFALAADEKDADKAETFFAKAALKGNPFAIYNLACFYYFDDSSRRDYLKAHYFALLGRDLFKDKGDRQYAKTLESVYESSLAKMTFFQKKYFETYIPQVLEARLSPEFKAGRKKVAAVSMPILNKAQVIRTIGVEPLEQNEAPKKGRLLFLPWTYPIDPKENAEFIKDFPPPEGALFAGDPAAIYGQTYRYDVPYKIDVALKERASTVVAKRGDKLTIHVLGNISSAGYRKQPVKEEHAGIASRLNGVALAIRYSPEIPTPRERDFQAWVAYHYEAVLSGRANMEFKLGDKTYTVVVLVE